MDQSARNSCTRSRRYYDIRHSTEIGSSQRTAQQKENMCVNAFNKFCPKKVEVNEATVEEAIKYGHFLKRSEEDISEAIDIYKTLGNQTFYSPEEEEPVDQQEQPEQ